MARAGFSAMTGEQTKQKSEIRWWQAAAASPSSPGSHEDISNTFVVLIAMEGIGSIERNIRIGLDVSIKFGGRFLRVEMHFIH
ncbi:hypothetical protein EJB05_31377, partial [Eragrostis curvula]